ncbi:hypothetical protein KBK19_05190 [Microvirga sp. STR05]|uniref:Uncharacterized protein n=1 Tax=Hymenobacter duratus TaxID=2771356 RepID=A0ABR8JHY9_9BACT|nr:hypothetical protein [Hymenobacter duratus]MBD2714419.1 hypothetical protein [Hymenobacter duratus]MBR7949323.1 hypothetical protein [Microvirga sp. STR05]
MSTVAPIALVDTEDSKYKVGQIWKYQTRPNERESLLTVVKVELQHEAIVVVHIHVDGLCLKPTEHGGKPGTTASHLPFSEEAMDASVIHLVTQVEQLPSFEEGYEMWREAFLDGKAGTFSITVAQVIDFIESSLNTH